MTMATKNVTKMQEIARRGAVTHHFRGKFPECFVIVSEGTLEQCSCLVYLGGGWPGKLIGKGTYRAASDVLVLDNWAESHKNMILVMREHLQRVCRDWVGAAACDYRPRDADALLGLAVGLRMLRGLPAYEPAKSAQRKLKQSEVG